MGFIEADDLFPEIQYVRAVRIDDCRCEITSIIDGVNARKSVFQGKHLIEPGSSKVLFDRLQWWCCRPVRFH